MKKDEKRDVLSKGETQRGGGQIYEHGPQGGYLGYGGVVAGGNTMENSRGQTDCSR